MTKHSNFNLSRFKEFVNRKYEQGEQSLIFDALANFEESNTEKQGIPISVFSSQITPFESIVKFLVEEEKESFTKIGRLLKKDRQVIWTTYKRAQEKFPRRLEKKSRYYIPLSEISSNKNSVPELIVHYLKDILGMKNSEISGIMKKDQRTIWTWYKRYQQKNG